MEQFDPYIVPTYYFVAIALCLVLAGARLLIETRAGLILQAIRDDQNRARYLGFDVPLYQTFFYAVSAGDRRRLAGMSSTSWFPGIRVADLYGSELLDHDGCVGRGRRSQLR